MRKKIALEGKSADYRAKIAEIQLRLKIEDDSDPFFWALASSSDLAHVFLDATDQFEESMKRMDIVRKKYQVLVDGQEKMQASQRGIVQQFNAQFDKVEAFLRQAAEENRSQWMRSLVATGGWFFAGVLALQSIYTFVPFSPLVRALQAEEAAKAYTEVVESGFGTLGSAWSWVRIKLDCLKQAEETGTSKCTIEL